MATIHRLVCTVVFLHDHFLQRLCRLHPRQLERNRLPDCLHWRSVSLFPPRNPYTKKQKTNRDFRTVSTLPSSSSGRSLSAPDGSTPPMPTSRLARTCSMPKTPA